MPRHIGLICLLILLVGQPSQARSEDSLTDLINTESFNIVMTVADREASNEFYGETLGLKKLGVWDSMPEDGVMDIYQAGATQLKLLSFPGELPKQPGGTSTARGIMLLTILFNDEAGVSSRLKQAGHDVSALTTIPGTEIKYGFVKDPDENTVEVVYFPTATPESRLQGFQVGLNVGDDQASRKFYGEVLGLPEQPTEDLGGGRTKYSFKYGQGTIKFWQTSKDMPAWTGYHADAIGPRYIQFPVSNIAKAHEKLVEAKADIAREPYEFASGVWLMFAKDPDGIYIEFPGGAPK